MPPLTAGAYQIEDAIDDFTLRDFAGPADLAGFLVGKAATNAMLFGLG